LIKLIYTLCNKNGIVAKKDLQHMANDEISVYERRLLQ